MSDASEVKQKDIHIHHQSGKAFILVELHNRIMAERDELWKRATKFVMPGEMDTGESIEHYIKTLEQTVAELKAEVEVLKNHHAEYEADCKRVEYFNDLHDKAARQARVIEKLRISMATALELESCGETSCPIPMRAMCSTPSHKELRKTLLEITAIEQEQGEGT